MTMRMGIRTALLAVLGYAAFLPSASDIVASSDDDRYDDDRYEYRNDYRYDDDRYEYDYRYDDDRYEYRDDRYDDGRYEYRYDDDRYEYRDDDRYRYDRWGGYGPALHSFDDWGVWALQHDRGGESILFVAAVFLIGPLPFPIVVGTPSGTDPIRGSAVWSGDVVAFDAGAVASPVNGDARLQVDFADGTLDVEFTNFTRGRSDMTWRGLSIVDGAFQRNDRLGAIDGAFFGDRHEAAAGEFRRDALRGVFGTLRR